MVHNARGPATGEGGDQASGTAHVVSLPSSMPPHPRKGLVQDRGCELNSMSFGVTGCASREGVDASVEPQLMKRSGA